MSDEKDELYNAVEALQSILLQIKAGTLIKGPDPLEAALRRIALNIDGDTPAPVIAGDALAAMAKDIEEFNMPLPDSGRAPDFTQPIEVARADLLSANLYFRWGQQTVGFGEAHISLNDDGSITADTEGMGKEWLRRALYAAVDTLIAEAKLR